MKTFIKLMGDVLAVDGNWVSVETKNGEYSDTHPVYVADAEAVSKLKPGDKVGVRGVIRRAGQRTVVATNTIKKLAKKYRDKYINQAGIDGDVVWAQFRGRSENGKSAVLNLGMADPGTSDSMLYATVFGDMATSWDRMMRGNNASVTLEGYMKSRHLEDGRQFYELNPSRQLSKIKLTPIKSGFEDAPDGAELMALEIEAPAPTGPEPGPSVGTFNQDDDIPF